MGVVLREKERLAKCLLNRAMDHRAKRKLKKQRITGKAEKQPHARTKEKVLGSTPYLMAVHFEFPHNFDGNLIILARGILCTVNVAKGTVAHLLQ
jgi:hypothetical protein